MGAEPTCLVCKKVMVKGSLLELSHGAAVHQPRWFEGEVTPSKWSGGDAKASQWQAGAKVTAYRCPDCFALRLYAVDG